MATAVSIGAADVLNEASGFNFNLRLQMAFSLLLFIVQSVLNPLYIVSMARYWLEFKRFEFDPAQDGFAEQEPPPTALWVQRVMGCAKLPRPAAEVPGPRSRTTNQLPTTDDTGASSDDESHTPPSGASSDTTSERSEWASDSDVEVGMSFAVGGAVPSAPPAPHTPPLGPPALPVTTHSSGPSTPPLTPLPTPASVAAPQSIPAGHAAPEAGDLQVTPSMFEGLWESLPTAGEFSSEVTSFPSLQAMREHLSSRGFVVVASGGSQEVDGTETLFAAWRCPAVQPPFCLVQVELEGGNEQIRVLFKAPADHDTTSTARAMDLAAVCGGLVPASS